MRLQNAPMPVATALAAVLLHAGPLHAQDLPPVVSRGVTGEVVFEYNGPKLQADPAQDLSAPLVLRLERDRDNSSRYIARFIGSVEGPYDLRSLIEHIDGSKPEDLEALNVTIVSTLPDRVRSDLFDAADLNVHLTAWYRAAMIGIVALWLCAPALYLWNRWRHRRPVQVPVPAVPPPTLADQLRPLVEAAASRQLEVSEQGRLELLLYAFWRERLSLAGADLVDAIRQIRSNPRSSELIQAVERWLHHPDHSGDEQSRIAQLLSPYRNMPAVPDDSLAAPGAVGEVRP